MALSAASLDLDFCQNVGTPLADCVLIGDAVFTYTGNGGYGYYFDENGNYIKPTNNEPRFQHDPTYDYRALGYLSESNRDNDCLASEDFGNATYWTLTNASIESNNKTYAARNGEFTADKYTSDADNSSLAQTISIADDRVVFSVHVKTSPDYEFAGSFDPQWLHISVLGDGTDGGEAWFDVLNGSVGTTANVGAGTYEYGDCLYLGRGWFRVWFMAEDTTATSWTVSMDITDADNSTTQTTGTSLLLWGAQYEGNARAISSYIGPTTTVKLSRVKDIMKDTTQRTWYTAGSPLTAFLEFYQVSKFAAANQRWYFYMGDAGGNDKWSMQSGSGTNTAYCKYTNSTGDDYDDSSGLTLTEDKIQRIAMTVDTDDALRYVNGTQEAVDNTVDLTSVAMPLFIIGNSQNEGNSCQCCIRKLRYWDSREANGDLATLADVPGQDYHINFDTGSDGGDGSSGSPWRTFAHLRNRTEAEPGDRYLLARGVIWPCVLWGFVSEGTDDFPIALMPDTDTTGAPPRIDGNGTYHTWESTVGNEWRVDYGDTIGANPITKISQDGWYGTSFTSGTITSLAQGEYGTTGNYVHVRCLADENPNSLSNMFVEKNFGINSGNSSASNLIVRGLTLGGQNSFLAQSGARKIMLQNCTGEYSRNQTFYWDSSSGSPWQIGEDLRVNESRNYGLYWRLSNNGTFRDIYMKSPVHSSGEGGLGFEQADNCTMTRIVARNETTTNESATDWYFGRDCTLSDSFFFQFGTGGSPHGQAMRVDNCVFDFDNLPAGELSNSRRGHTVQSFIDNVSSSAPSADPLRLTNNVYYGIDDWGIFHVDSANHGQLFDNGVAIFTNNTFVVSSAATGQIRHITYTNLQPPTVSDFNNFWNEQTGVNTPEYAYAGAEYYSLADWQSNTGYDQHSYEQDPNITFAVSTGHTPGDYWNVLRGTGRSPADTDRLWFYETTVTSVEALGPGGPADNVVTTRNYHIKFQL